MPTTTAPDTLRTRITDCLHSLAERDHRLEVAPGAQGDLWLLAADSWQCLLELKVSPLGDRLVHALSLGPIRVAPPQKARVLRALLHANLMPQSLPAQRLALDPDTEEVLLLAEQPLTSLTGETLLAFCDEMQRNALAWQPLLDGLDTAGPALTDENTLRA